jgi:hypothetical protein
MKFFMTLAGLVLWFIAGAWFFSAPTSIQQIGAAIVGVSGSVLFSGAAIMQTIEDRLPLAAAKAAEVQSSTAS